MSRLPSIDAVALPDHYSRDEFQGKTAVVIDVLRASTTIIAALDSGASGIVPKCSVDSAREYAAEHHGSLLCGERSAMKVEGFDLGNSPLEYTPEIVMDRVVVLSTTNGTRAIELSKSAESIYVGSLTNREALVEELFGNGRDVVLVCSGTDGKESEEDCFGAGMIADKLEGWGVLSEQAGNMRDKALGALKSHGDVPGVLFNSFHGKRISKLGLDPDIYAAANIDSSSCVPVLRDGEMLVRVR